ncbi:MAG: aldo/keto reductase [Silvibacterium sp.]|nr:aldo/keto reductase [Silvibacterium sp.]
MQITKLGQTGIATSVLGFGCSALLGRSGRSESLAALGAAWDSGINLFDTARSYGYGESEALLGEFLRGRRDKAVISTKFGILAAPQALWKRVAKPIARKLLSIAPSTRGMIRKGVAAQFSANQFTVAVLEQSIHESLRKLGTDYVDLLFMHAAPVDVLDNEQLLTALDRLVRSGKVRAAGISADPDVIAETLRRKPPVLRALQFPCNVFDLSVAGLLDEARQFAAIANHPFGGAARVQTGREILWRVAGSERTPPVLREKLREVDDGVLADVVLNVILRGTGIDAVVPAMMKIPHLQKNVAAVTASRFTTDEIAMLRDALSQEVVATAAPAH